MVSKSQIKFITLLRQKKYRNLHKLFVAEGPKLLVDFLRSGLLPEKVYTTEPLIGVAIEAQEMVTTTELKKISNLKNPNTCLAVFPFPKATPVVFSETIVVLDRVRDPGNLGTIIRLCDWFGISHLVCAPETADCLNPKVVQATMGSLARVGIHYLDLVPFLQEAAKHLPVYGAFMDGENMYASKLAKKAVLVMGNEGKGISPEVEKLVSKRISIPQFGTHQETESLNVASATAILLGELFGATER